jgi:flagellar export protein FliJ
MKRFDFRLRSVLVLRNRAVGEAEQRYSRAIETRRNAEKRLREAFARQAALNQAMVDRQLQSLVSGLQHEGQLLSIQGSKKILNVMEQQVQQAKAVENRERIAYVEARRQFELLDQLREKQQGQHLMLQIQEEQKEMDDLFNARKSAGRTVDVK